MVVTAVANDAGEFTVELPAQGPYSVSARLKSTEANISSSKKVGAARRTGDADASQD